MTTETRAERRRDDARLIAAAPKLLAALEAAQLILKLARRAASENEPYYRGVHAQHIRDIEEQARQAIAEAKEA